MVILIPKPQRLFNIQKYFYQILTVYYQAIKNIVAAFRGMHVSPAKHSYAWLPRKCDYRTDGRTDRQTDTGQSDPYVPLCFAGDTKTKTFCINQRVTLGADLGALFRCINNSHFQNSIFFKEMIGDCLWKTIQIFRNINWEDCWTAKTKLKILEAT